MQPWALEDVPLFAGKAGVGILTGPWVFFSLLIRRQDQGSGVGGGLAKLARLLMQKEKTVPGERSPSASSALLSPPAPTSSTSSVFDP